MLILNLLPKEAEKQIESEKILSLIKRQILILFILVLIISLFFLTAKIILKKQLDILLSSLKASKVENLELNNKIKKLNQDVDDFQKIQSNFINWPSFIVQFNQLIPNGINISLFNMSNAGEISLNGVFADRVDFIKFQDNLKNSELVLEIVSSSKNLLQREDNEFSLNLKVDIDKIKND